MQTGFLKNITLLALAFATVCGHAQTPTNLLQKADSLYTKKQFTQSFELYQRIHQAGQYSPAMFLKMAFIQEGLDKPGLALYYLNLYYLASNDDQTLVKMDELAAKNGLTGYEHTPLNTIREAIARYRTPIAGALAAVVLLLMAVGIYQTRKGHKPVTAMVVVITGLIVLGLFVNFFKPNRTAIITGTNTIAMNGPSAGASAVGLLKEGNKVRIQNAEDVWLKVYWANRYVYVRQSQVLEVTL